MRASSTKRWWTSLSWFIASLWIPWVPILYPGESLLRKPRGIDPGRLMGVLDPGQIAA